MQGSLNVKTMSLYLLLSDLIRFFLRRTLDLRFTIASCWCTFCLLCIFRCEKCIHYWRQSTR